MTANFIQDSLLSQFPDHLDRGVKKAGFYVLKHTNMPAVLIECEFLSNPNHRRFLKEPENQLALAGAIKTGIMKGDA
jgi:N-acetylmuramoyl-L-alanine amidase